MSGHAGLPHQLVLHLESNLVSRYTYVTRSVGKTRWRQQRLIRSAAAVTDEVNKMFIEDLMLRPLDAFQVNSFLYHFP